jgi:glycosyltransferase involved in cell wall biosynthesis/O-antigen/teichoic acid export membrane protein
MTAQLDVDVAPVTEPAPLLRLSKVSPLLRNAAMLVVSSGATSALAFLFWTIAARLYPIGQVGAATTLVSGVSLLSYLGLFGLSSSLVMFLPRSSDPAREASASIGLSALGGLAFGLGYAALLPVIAPDAWAHFSGAPAIVLFVVVVAAAAANLVTDSVFIALRAAHWNVVVDGIIQGAVKLAPLALLVGAGTLGIFGAYGLGSIAAVGASIAILRRRLKLRIRPQRVRGSLPGYLSFSTASYASSLFNLAPLLLLPIIVLDTQGTRAAAVYYVAFQFATLLNTVTFAICESLFAEAAHMPDRTRALARRSALYIVLCVTPLALLIAAAARPVLGLFGSEYQAGGAQLLRILCLATVAVAVNTWTSFLLKIAWRMGWLVASNVVYVGLAAALPIALRSDGLRGVGWAWLAANAGSAAVAIVGLVNHSRPRSAGRGPVFDGPDSALRILQIIDVGWAAGGAERSVVLLRARLEAAGHRVRVLSTDLGAQGRDTFADVVVPAIGGNPLRRLARKLFYPRSYRAVRAIVRDFAPDVVHVHTVGELSPSVLFALRRTPYVLTVHGPEDFLLRLLPWHLPAGDYRNRSYRWRDVSTAGRLRYLYLRWLQRPSYLLALRACRRFVAPSEFMADVLTDEAAPSTIEQIYNGIDLPAPSPVPADGPFVYVGRLEAVKGVANLLAAIATLAADRPALRLVVVGDGTERARLVDQALRLGIVDRVRFAGSLDPDGVIEQMRQSRAVVIPSVWPENLPTVALEALGVGRAIVGSRIGGIPELVDDGTTGFLVPPDDVAALADALARLADDPVLAAGLGAAAAERRADFDIDSFVTRLVTLYREVVDQP